MTEEKTITRDDLMKLAEAWAGAEYDEGRIHGHPESSFARSHQATGRSHEAREAFEKALDAFVGQRPTVSTPPGAEVTIVGPVQSGTLRPYSRG